MGRGNLDAILAEHKDQQERVAEEMIALTRYRGTQYYPPGRFVVKSIGR